MNYTLQKPICMNIDEEWKKKLVQMMEKAAKEEVGKKKKYRKEKD
jgi:hypothetical protein